MISDLLQRPVRGEPTRAPNRMPASGDRRTTFMAHAGLAAASAVALLSSSGPSPAGDIVVTQQYGWQNSGTIDGNITFTGTNVGIIRNTGSINGSITVNSGGKIENFGVITGNINMPTGYVVNYSGGVINSGATIDVNSIGFYNYGALSPGGDNAVQTTSISGDFSQGFYFSEPGSYVTTLASPTSADKLAITGDANLAGIIVVNRTGSIGNTGQVAILTAAGTLTNSATVTQNGWGYSLTTDSAYDPSTHTTVDRLLLNWNRMSLASYLSSVTLTAQQSQVATILANAEAGGNAAMRFVNDSLLDGDLASAKSFLGIIAWPEAFVASMSSIWQANNGFVQAVNSCPTFGVNPGFIQEGQCYWAKFDGRRSDWNTTATNIGGQDETYSFSGGIQVALRDEWRLGFAGSYQNSTIKTPTSVRTESDRMEGAIVLKNRWDRLSVSATAFAGYGWADTERTMFGLIGAAESDYGTWLAGSNLRLSYLFELPSRWYVKPLVDLNATHIGIEGFTEHGAGGANLAVQGSSAWVLAASPAIEIGTEITAKGITYRPYVRAGGTFLDDATFDVTASFVAAPGQFLTSTSEFDDKYVDIAAGVDILTADGVDLKLTYDGRYSENSSELSLGAKAAVPF
jgi:autotransporter-like protein